MDSESGLSKHSLIMACIRAGHADFFFNRLRKYPCHEDDRPEHSARMIVSAARESPAGASQANVFRNSATPRRGPISRNSLIVRLRVDSSTMQCFLGRADRLDFKNFSKSRSREAALSNDDPSEPLAALAHKALWQPCSLYEVACIPTRLTQPLQYGIGPVD